METNNESKQVIKQTTNQSRLKEVLAVVNNKGGVGKTTTVQSLAVAITRQDKQARVLVIDLDPQWHLSKLMGWQQGRGRTVYDALREQTGLPVYQVPRKKNGYNQPITDDKGIWLCPSEKALQGVDAYLTQQMQPVMALRKCFFKGITTTDAIDGVRYDGAGPIVPAVFDYVLIDCPPALSKSTYNAMAVANGLLIPTTLEGMSVSGIAPILVDMQSVKQELNPQLELTGVLPTMTDLRSNIARDILADLRKKFGSLLMLYQWNKSNKTPLSGIPALAKMNEAQTKKLSIYDWQPYSTAGMAYEQLAKSLFF